VRQRSRTERDVLDVHINQDRETLALRKAHRLAVDDRLEVVPGDWVDLLIIAPSPASPYVQEM